MLECVLQATKWTISGYGSCERESESAISLVAEGSHRHTKTVADDIRAWPFSWNNKKRDKRAHPSKVEGNSWNKKKNFGLLYAFYEAHGECFIFRSVALASWELTWLDETFVELISKFTVPYLNSIQFSFALSGNYLLALRGPRWKCTDGNELLWRPIEFVQKIGYSKQPFEELPTVPGWTIKSSIFTVGPDSMIYGPQCNRLHNNGSIIRRWQRKWQVKGEEYCRPLRSSTHLLLDFGFKKIQISWNGN